ncbi:DUF3048 domain-containing protein [Virgibacillus necropolis]|uniref:Lipoprotein YerB n=1 Tax=Virgibacillus necropolis TaxID=163877 RepID=A0A221MH91_9BACI|nr:DUF3048 domain-containing protein [Virgibacillus necropolis]ASN07000.1 lipoprotein YerB [Virgibacillus necropolis]
MKKPFFYLIAALVVLLIGCSKEEGTATNNQDKENAVEEKANTPETHQSAEFVYPLTGMEADKQVENRTIGIMVNNHAKARPQTGLSKADIVFEILAEGPITRFLALFQSELPDVVGPVRSAREYYFELANGYNALYVYHGAANFVNDMIQERGIEHLNGSLHDNDGHLFERESFRKAPHNSYVQVGAIYDVAESKGYSVKANDKALPFLNENEIKEIAGDSASHIKIVYSDQPEEIVEYDYDEELGKYKRYSDQDQTVELNSNEPILVDNIFVVKTDHEVIDDAGRRAVDLTSGGEGYLVQKGKIQKLNWKNQNGRIIPVKDGKPVGFVPGKTWINVVPLNTPIHVSK